jgi:hypothetical protein
MSDTAPRNPGNAGQMLADALLRSVSGTSAQLRVTGTTTDTNQAELGLVATTFAQIVLSPVVMRKLRPAMNAGDANRFELLVSASGVQAQVNALSLSSAQSLFAMTMAVTVDGRDFLIDSIASNEALGQVYLYRLTLREALQQRI